MYSWSKRRSFNILKGLIIILLVSFYSFSISVNAVARIKVKPQQIKFRVESKPIDNLTIKDVIEIERRYTKKQYKEGKSKNNKMQEQAKNKQDDDRNKKQNKGSQAKRPIYYRVTDLENEEGDIIANKYILAKTPYSFKAISLIYPILFLAKNDHNSKIKLKLAKEVWSKVPHGTYEGWLKSTEAPPIKVVVEIKPSISVRTETDGIEINAINGPGNYYAEGKVKITVEANHSNWNLRIYSEPLNYEQEKADKTNISPKKLLVALRDKNGIYNNLATGITINGSDYQNGVIIDAYFKAKVYWEDVAGNYQGKIYFTLEKTK